MTTNFRPTPMTAAALLGSLFFLTGMWGLAQRETAPIVKENEKPFANPKIQLLSSNVPKIYYRLPQLEKQNAELVFHVNLNGQPFSSQSLILEGIMDENPVIHFMLEHPKAAAMLSVLDRTAGNDIEVQVILNGSLIEALSFDAFLEKSDRLKAQADLLAWVASASRLDWLRVEATALSIKANPLKATSCESDCYDDYEDCSIFYCGNPTVFCDPCLDELSQCLANCPSEPNCPTQSSVTNRVHLSSSSLGWFCMQDYIWQNEYQYYNRIRNWYQDCTTTTHVPCEGSPYTTTSCSSPFYIDCNSPTFITCFYGFGYPWNLCF